MEQRAVALIKNKAQLPITANDNIVFNNNLLGIRRLWDNYKEYHIISLIQWLNRNGLMNIITEIHLKWAQLILNSHVPVFELNIDQL